MQRLHWGRFLYLCEMGRIKPDDAKTGVHHADCGVTVMHFLCYSFPIRRRCMVYENRPV